MYFRIVCFPVLITENLALKIFVSAISWFNNLLGGFGSWLNEPIDVFVAPEVSHGECSRYY